jgi:type IV secretory pathway VirB3-like protein
MTDEPDNLGIRVPPPPVYLLALILGLLLDKKAHVPFLPRRVAASSLGCLWEAGWPSRRGSLGRCAESTLRSASTRPYPAWSRMGRSATAATLAMIYTGIAVLRNALWAILLLPLVVYVIQREVIEREERYLERTFGEEYLSYKARVRRWV